MRRTLTPPTGHGCQRRRSGFVLAAAAVITSLFWLGACTVLPTTSSKSKSTWPSYTDARSAFDAVTIGRSTREDITRLGFDPAKVPNIRILNYVDVVNLFGPAFKLEDLPEGIRTCVKARDDCFAYNVRVQNITNQRDGNVPADLLGFRKQVHTSGWEFQATLVLVRGVVAYKLWNGTPDIQSTSHEVTPLGPMQNLGGVIPKPF